MQRGSGSISGDQIQHTKSWLEKQQRSDKPDNPDPPPSKTKSSTEEELNEKTLQKRPDILRNESDEFVTTRSRKRARTGLVHSNARTVTANIKNKPPRTKSKKAEPKIPSSRQSRRAGDGSRSPKLLAEPPPGRTSTTTPAVQQGQSLDPDFELRKCAREEFRQTGDYSAFHTLLAPFRKGNTKRELSDWVFNEEKQRWGREDKSSGLIIWAPKADSFL